MEITKTHTYRFTTAELQAIKVFCQLADSIAISENMDYHNNDYYAEDFFHKIYIFFRFVFGNDRKDRACKPASVNSYRAVGNNSPRSFNSENDGLSFVARHRAVLKKGKT